MSCRVCHGPVPLFLWGRGEWIYLANGAEIGPLCSASCVQTKCDRVAAPVPNWAKRGDQA